MPGAIKLLIVIWVWMIIASFISIIISASLENMTFNFSCSIGDILLYSSVAAVTLLFTDALQLGVQRLHDAPKSLRLCLKVICGVSFHFLHSTVGEESISFFSIILACFLKLLSVEDNTGLTIDEYKMIKNCFINGMGPFRKDTMVVAIHRNSYSGLLGKARLETFQIFCEAVGKKCGGDSNMKFVWYGGSKNEIRDIISHGFTHCKQPENRGLYGVGVSLSPTKFSMESALLSFPMD